MEEIIFRYLSQNPVLKDIRKIPKNDVKSTREFTYAYEGKINLVENDVIIQIAFNKKFPRSKPIFFLKDPNVLGFIPHIEVDGYICYMQDEGSIINQDNPQGIINYCLNKAINIIHDGVMGLNTEDFLKEFEAYWRRLDKKVVVKSIVKLDDSVKTFTVFQVNKSNEVFFGENRLQVQKYVENLFGIKQLDGTFYRGIYIPLREKSKVFPPHHNKPWGVNTLRQIVFNNITSSNKTKLNNLLKKISVSKGQVEFIMISIPFPDVREGRSTIGIKYSNFIKLNNRKRTPKEFSHPLYRTECRCEITPIEISRHDKEYLIPRTGGLNSLSDKNVLIIGCGSVGGGIISELVKAGITRLSLIDNDILNIENVYRHLLGMDSLYKGFYDNKENRFRTYLTYKVDAIADELKKKYFYLEIDHIADEVENVFEDKRVVLKDFDLIIIATGNPTIEINLNRYLHKEAINIPVIFSWLEPLGIGGHALLTNNNGQNGCYDCLFFDPIENESGLINRASFSVPNQFFAKAVSGCGSLFTPYSSLDALQTVIITVRLAINTLLKNEKDNPLVSWKGESSNFIEQGYKLSDRYAYTSEELFETRYAYKNSSCKTCKGDLAINEETLVRNNV